MATRKAVRDMLSAESRRHYAAISAGSGENCGYANLALVLIDEIDFLREKLTLIHTKADRMGANWATQVAKDGLTHEGEDSEEENHNG